MRWIHLLAIGLTMTVPLAAAEPTPEEDPDQIPPLPLGEQVIRVEIAGHCFDVQTVGECCPIKPRFTRCRTDG